MVTTVKVWFYLPSFRLAILNKSLGVTEMAAGLVSRSTLIPYQRIREENTTFTRARSSLFSMKQQ